MTESLPTAVALPSLFAALDDARAFGDLERAARDIAQDSRRVQTGSVFVALRGERADGHAFIERAVAAGAGAVVVDEAYAQDHAPLTGIATVVVPDTRRALSRLSAAFYGYPSRTMPVVGVTGTNGKTTTAHLIAALLQAGGVACGLIGTLGASFEERRWPLDNTTPLALELQALLAAMRGCGAAAVAMEVSSHALALERVADVVFGAGVLTNVTRDHLDFHGTFDAYAAAKRSLFETVPFAALCIDYDLGRRWAGELSSAGKDIVTYGFAEDAAVRAGALEIAGASSVFAVDGRIFTLPLAGRFNVRNALAALCVARRFGIDDAISARALAAVKPVPGRMESFSGGGITVLVDYAHTPDALDNALRAAREASRAGLTVVFGCGGDRDRGKRPQMGRIAAELADRVILTNDNPRGEAPGAIIAGVLVGAPDAGNVEVEFDRHSAILAAILGASSGDVVLVAGKGHETYQLQGDTTLHFDDREEVRAALSVRQGGRS